MMPTWTDGRHEDEQADKEEEGPPFDFAERVMGVDAADDHEHRRPQQGDRCCLEAECPVDQKPDEHEGTNDGTFWSTGPDQ